MQTQIYIYHHQSFPYLQLTLPYPNLLFTLQAHKQISMYVYHTQHPSPAASPPYCFPNHQHTLPIPTPDSPLPLPFVHPINFTPNPTLLPPFFKTTPLPYPEYNLGKVGVGGGGIYTLPPYHIQNLHQYLFFQLLILNIMFYQQNLTTKKISSHPQRYIFIHNSDKKSQCFNLDTNMNPTQKFFSYSIQYTQSTYKNNPNKQKFVQVICIEQKHKHQHRNFFLTFNTLKKARTHYKLVTVQFCSYLTQPKM
eukprot:TRINITY_DN5122_c0_g2_i1.p2 TRINITY_DN5122_c0_g2~~TRINITY_DN5122_c0_g2_i1.p2  ORF type:complete len:251 (+),score=-9.05 TRINITY_DN5122_c0_g2_i1:512-1264(+)